MSDETDTTSEVARVLGEHQYYVPQGQHPDGILPDDVEWECAGCGHGIGADDVMEERHVAHMAQMLVEAGLLRDDGPALVLPDPKGGCICSFESEDRGGGHSELVQEYEPACPVHSEHLYDPRTGVWVQRTEEAQIAAQEPAGATRGGSGDSRASGGLGERLRALGTGQTRTLRKVLRAMAVEADRLEEALRSTTHQLELEQDDVCIAHGTVRPCRHCAYAASASEEPW